MTLKQLVIAVCAGLAIALVATVSIREHTLRVQAEARIAVRDQEDAQNRKAAAREAAAITTAPQAVQTIIRYVPMPQKPTAAPAPAEAHSVSPAQPTPAEVPQVAEVQKSDFTEQAQQKIPDAPDYVVLTTDQAVANARQLVQCRADQASLLVCRKDAADLERVVKGGSFWRRVGHKAKCLAITSGGSALGAWVDKNQPARGAFIGAAAGGVGCEIF